MAEPNKPTQPTHPTQPQSSKSLTQAELAEQRQAEQPTHMQSAQQPLKPLSDKAGSDIEQLKAENAALRQQVEAGPVLVAPPRVPRPTTSGTFKLTEPYYRQGVMYLAGQTITIENEVPGKSWERVDPSDHDITPAHASHPQGQGTPQGTGQGQGTGRPNDRNL